MCTLLGPLGLGLALIFACQRQPHEGAASPPSEAPIPRARAAAAPIEAPRTAALLGAPRAAASAAPTPQGTTEAAASEPNTEPLAWPAATGEHSAGVAPSSGPATLDRVTFQTAGTEALAERPVVVALHGLGDRPESFALPFHELGLAAAFVVPRAPHAWHGGHAWFPIELWQLDPEALAPRIVQAAELVGRSIERWRAAWPPVGDRHAKPILVGYSQGGMIALYLALHRPDLVERAIVVAGWLPRPLLPLAGPAPGGPRIVALHGEADRVVPLGPTREALGVLERLGYPVELQTFPGGGHRFTAESRRALLDAVRVAVRAVR